MHAKLQQTCSHAMYYMIGAGDPAEASLFVHALTDSGKCCYRIKHDNKGGSTEPA